MENNNVISENEYNELKNKYDIYHKALMQFLKENKKNWIDQEESKLLPEDLTHDQISSLEVYEFVNDIPDKYFIYVNEKERIVTTWTGEKLGRITFLGSKYQSNLGDMRKTLHFTGINNKKYYGIFYCGNGDYARVRLYKNQ